MISGTVRLSLGGGVNDFDNSDGLFSEIPVFMQIFMVGFVVVFFLSLAFIVFIWIRNWRALKSAGLDPLAAQSQIAGQLANSDLLAGKRPTEDRLRELDDLHARGVISDDEHRTARAAALSDG
jgi:hypothetical protein